MLFRSKVALRIEVNGVGNNYKYEHYSGWFKKDVGMDAYSGIRHVSIPIPKEGKYTVQFIQYAEGGTSTNAETIGANVFGDMIVQPKRSVTCIDVVKGTTTELGRQTREKEFGQGEIVKGSDFGDNQEMGFYYADYMYDSCTSATVGEEETGTTVYRYFKGENNTLTVDPAGGTWEASTDRQTFELEQGATKAISLPTRSGYNFSGWTLTGAGSTMSSLIQASTYTMGTEDATLTATWAPITYQVAYHGNGNTNTSVTMPNSTHTYNVDQNLSKNLYERIYHVTYNYNGKPGADEERVDARAQFVNWKAQLDNTNYNDEQSVKNLCSTQGAVYH